jgi:hypothetical protein
MSNGTTQWDMSQLTPIHPSVLGILRRLKEWCDECERMKCLHPDHHPWTDEDCAGCQFLRGDGCEVGA